MTFDASCLHLTGVKLQHPAPLRPVSGFDIGSLLGTAGTIAGASSGVPGASALGGSVGSAFGTLFGGSGGGSGGSGSNPVAVTTTTSTQVNPNFSINVGSSGSTFSASGSGQSASPGSVDQYGNPVASTGTTLSTNQKYILIGGAALLAIAIYYSYSGKK